MSRVMLAACCLLLVLLIGSCDDGATAPPTSSDVLRALVLSDPTAGDTGVGADGSAAASATLTFVSLQDGTANEAASVRITNLRTMESVATQVTNGGFGPVGIAATEGDSLEVVLLDATNHELARLLQPVPISRRPVVVRTRPPRGKKDVPLNIRMNVVFSEPINPASLTRDNVRLIRASDGAVAGLELVSTDPTSVDLVINAPLAAGADYRIEISDAVHDLDGDSLAAAVVVDFATDPNGEGGVIAFFKDDGIYVADSTGRYPTRITQQIIQRHIGVGLSWSPDGQRIAFAAPRFRPPSEPGLGIFLINADGSGRMQLTRPPGAADDIQPAWSPDGRTIAFVRWTLRDPLSPIADVYLVDADGSDLRFLGSGENPTWSSDGARIGFYRGDGFYEMTPFGTGLRRVADDLPVWSPDGSRYAYVSHASGNLDIWIANADGTSRRLLTNHGSDDVDPAWSPDGSRIVFSRGDENAWLDLYSMDTDGSNVIRHSESKQANEMGAKWSRPARLPATGGLVLEGLSDESQIDTVFAVRSPFRVRVTQDGVPAAGVEVRWTTSDAFRVTSSAITDALGEAAFVPVFTDSMPQHVAIEASADARGSPAIFHAFTTPASPARIRFGHPWSIFRNPKMPEDIAQKLATAAIVVYEVEPTDAYGNGVSDPVRVDFSVGSGGGSVSPSTDTTAYWPDDEHCVMRICAYTHHTLGAGSAEQTVVVTAPDLASRPQLTFSTIRVDTIIASGGCDGISEGFGPDHVSLSVGGTVGWTLWCNADVHNVTFDAQPGAPSNSSDGGIHVATFATPGTYRYRCSLHSSSSTEGEVGVVVVK